MDSTNEIWKELKDRYHQENVFHISHLEDEIYSFHFNDHYLFQKIKEALTRIRDVFPRI